MEDELYHHGIKGMKWGVRRTPEQLGRSSGQKRKRAGNNIKSLLRRARKAPSSFKEKMLSKIQARKDAKRARQLSRKDRYTKSPDAMYKHRDLFTNEELDAYRTRFTKEQALKDLTTERNLQTYQRGMNFISATKPAIETIGAAYKVYSDIKKATEKPEKPTIPIPSKLPESRRVVTVSQDGKVSYVSTYENPKEDKDDKKNN